MSMKRCKECGARYGVKWHHHRVSSTCPYCGHFQDNGPRVVESTYLPGPWQANPNFYAPKRYIIEEGEREGTVRIFFSSRYEEFTLDELRSICTESEEILKNA